MSIFIRPLHAEEWGALKTIRLKALRAHPGVYLGLIEDAAARSDTEWKAIIEGDDRCVFGLFDNETLVGITAIFTSK